MRRRLSSMLMVFVVLSLVLSAVAVVAPAEKEASAQSGGLNSWVRHDLPTTLHWQMAPNTDIWDLTAADDGTLFALVEDTSGPIDLISGSVMWDGLRWAVFPAWSDISLFKSTDGGYTWTLMWHQPASDEGAPIAVVPQPGYVEGNSGKDVIFIATGTRYLSPGSGYVGGPQEGNLYRSTDGGSSFTRVTPRNPSVTLIAGGTITCLDVAENINAPGTYMAIVGTSSLGISTPAVPRGEGVWTWNEDNDRDWKDQMVANALPPAPFPGSMPAGNGLDVIAVLASPTYTEDGTFMAVVNDILPGDPAASLPGIYVCYWDNFDGTWGGDVDSPTTARIAMPDYAWAACMAVGDDFTQVVNNYIFVGIDGSGLSNDVWRIQGLATVTGPSRATATMLGAPRISDIMVQGPAASGAVYVGCELPIGALPNTGTGQAQVIKGIQATLWPAWTPSFKPPSGRWPTFVTDMSGTVMAAGGGNGFSYGGVHVMVEGFGGRNVFNGVGLLDDIAVSEDIPGFVNNDNILVLGTSWCLAEAHAEEVSPTFETDKLMYVSTFSYWDADNTPIGSDPQPEAGLSLWRWTDSAHWERILKENVASPTALSGGGGSDLFAGKPWLLSGLAISTHTVNTWWPRVPRGFSTDPYVFLLGGLSDSVDGWQQELLWYSPDKGDSWIPFDQMPIGAAPLGAGLSECGWWVEDNNTIFCGDIAGWVYKTTDRGASWTEGALTAAGLEVDSIITSPTYSETGNSDKCVLVGTFDPSLPGGGGTGDTQHEIWLSQDGAEQDLENVGAEICTAPAWSGSIGGGIALLSGYGLTVVNFDPGWETNRMVYSTASTWLDLWQLVGTGSTKLTRIDSTDVGVYRTEINLNEPSASTWEQVWDADDFNAIAPEPQPVEGMLPSWITFRYALISDLQIGQDGTMYVPFAVYDFSRNFDTGTFLEKPPSPHGPGRFTAGGVLRSLEPTQAVTEWDVIDKGLGEWDGLFLNRAPVGDSNTLISLAWDFQEWRWKLAIYDDTLCTQSAPAEPVSGDTAVGNIAGNNKVSVVLDWAELDADVYQWQVDNDCGFVAPMIKEGNTTETLVTVTGLDPDVKYCWRVRALQPALSRWSDAQDFHTVMGTELNAPQLLSPKAGTAIAEHKPVFQWSAIGWADKYQIQVATDGGFATAALVIDETLGNTQGYQSPDELEDGTYYWRVKAMSDTSQTSWSSTGIFSIGGKLVGGGPAAWVWVLIVIGVVLLLVMAWITMKLRIKN